MIAGLMWSASGVPVRRSVAEFLAWEPADGQTWQLVDGEPPGHGAREILVSHMVSVAADLSRRRPDGGWPKDPDSIVAGELILDSIGFHAPLPDIDRTTRLSGTGR